MESQSTTVHAQRPKSTTAVAVWLLGLTFFFAIAPMTAHARWYDPERGRFMSRAPYQPHIEHQYGFVENDPINFTDPTGELRLGSCIVGGACLAMITLHMNACIHACGTIWDTRQACTDDGHEYTQVFDTGETDWGCVGQCIADGLSGWRGKTFMAVCGATGGDCIRNLSKLRPHGHGPRSHHGKGPHIKIGVHKKGVPGSGIDVEIPWPF
jgi:hypothetical protein